MIDAGLNRIALADADIKEARAILQSALDGMTPDLAHEVGIALRAWVWKALTSRRSDQELTEWHGLFEQVRARLTPINAMAAERVAVLSELIYESIASADISDPELVLQRSHARKLLALLLTAPDLRRDRSWLEPQLGLPQANLTRMQAISS